MKVIQREKGLAAFLTSLGLSWGLVAVPAAMADPQDQLFLFK